jgi:hypothetical protein
MYSEQRTDFGGQATQDWPHIVMYYETFACMYFSDRRVGTSLSQLD